MTRRATPGDPEAIRRALLELIADFEQVLGSADLRERVLALVPAVHLLRDLGVSLGDSSTPQSARDRILQYLTKYPLTVIAGDELAVVSGISEYARRIRELRVQFGWPIYSGVTAKQMVEDERSADTHVDLPIDAGRLETLQPDDYILIGEQDRDAAHRWALANEIRRQHLSVRDRLLTYLRANVGRPVTGEELRYVAKAQSWPRRTRELRTEFGWPVVTRNSGRPDLALGAYLLEADRQSEPHDRHIPDAVRVTVLTRDGFACRCCGWEPADHPAGDPRSLLELHHVEYHAEGGPNDPENLVTLCNVHHDDVHRAEARGRAAFDAWLEHHCAH